jgi:hypothetical protein
MRARAGERVFRTEFGVGMAKVYGTVDLGADPEAAVPRAKNLPRTANS